MNAPDRQRAFVEVVHALDALVDVTREALHGERELHHRTYLDERLQLLRAARTGVYDSAQRRRPVEVQVPGQLRLDDPETSR